MTFPTEVSIPLLKDVKIAGAERGLRGRAEQRLDQHHRQLVRAAVRQSRHPPRAGAGARPQGVHLDPVRGPGRHRRHHAAARRRGCGRCPRKCWRRSRATAPTSNANREEARKLMAEGGLRSGQASRGQGLDPQHPGLSRSRRHPDRPDQEHLYRRRTRCRRHRAMVPESRAQGLFARPQPHRQRGRRSRPVVLRELFLRLGAQLHQLLQQGHREAVRPAIGRDRRRQAQEAGLGYRQEAAGRRRPPDHLPRPRPAPAGSPMSRASPSW